MNTERSPSKSINPLVYTIMCLLPFTLASLTFNSPTLPNHLLHKPMPTNHTPHNPNNKPLKPPKPLEPPSISKNKPKSIPNYTPQAISKVNPKCKHTSDRKQDTGPETTTQPDVDTTPETTTQPDIARLLKAYQDPLKILNLNSAKIYFFQDTCKFLSDQYQRKRGEIMKDFPRISDAESKLRCYEQVCLEIDRDLTAYRKAKEMLSMRNKEILGRLEDIESALEFLEACNRLRLANSSKAEAKIALKTINPCTLEIDTINPNQDTALVWLGPDTLVCKDRQGAREQLVCQFKEHSAMLEQNRALMHQMVESIAITQVALARVLRWIQEFRDDEDSEVAAPLDPPSPRATRASPNQPMSR
uniref:Prefoldin subunit 3 n=2 Tax=Amorphochlora amoebiformis TaxID=1561963 RepID=A0A7S0DPF5_9EUKA|mmetsp:Transcript_34533/g.55622  ORF Transcript_34533/g.55622 Transcript_34533/m.55622 type:complete len:360 (+) Transcript_34533:420-1499(+)